MTNRYNMDSQRRALEPASTESRSEEILGSDRSSSTTVVARPSKGYKEGKYAVKWTRLSFRNFKDNQARLQLFALAYNLGDCLRRLALPRSVRHWSLTTLR